MFFRLLYLRQHLIGSYIFVESIFLLYQSVCFRAGFFQAYLAQEGNNLLGINILQEHPWSSRIGT